MKPTYRRLILAGLLLAVAGAIWFALDGGPVFRDRIPGRYKLASADGKSVTVSRFEDDGNWTAETFPLGAAEPKSVIRGRWRVSGSVLVIESGSQAATPVSFLDHITERFSSPTLGSETTRLRIISANENGLVLSYGADVNTGQDVRQTLTRVGAD